MAKAKTSIVISARDLASKPIKGVAGSIAGLGRSVGRLRFMMLGLGTALGGFGLAKEFIDANAQLEQMRLRIGSLLGDMKAGDQAIEWVREFQKENPVRTIQEYSEAFQDLVAAGINPTTGALKSLTAGAVKFGLTADDVKGVTRALRQGLALPNFQKQELNQLAERIPGVMKVLAEEMGKSVGELRKQMELGLVDSTEVAQAILRGIGKDADKTIKSFGNTWMAGMNRLKSAWFDLLTQIGEAGIFDRVKNAVEKLTSFIKDNMGEIRESVVVVLNFVADMAVKLAGMGTGFDFKLKPVLILITNIISQVANFFTMMKVALTASVALMTKLLNLTTNIAARGRAVEEGVLFATEGGVKKEIDRLQKLVNTYRWAQQSGERSKIAISKMDMVDDGGIEEVSRRLASLRQVYKDLKADINESAVDFDFTETMNQMSETQRGILKTTRETVNAIKGLNFTNLDDTFISAPKVKDELNKALEPLVNMEAKQAEVADKTTGTWKESMKKIKDDFSEKFGTMEKLGMRFSEGLNESLSQGFSRFFGELIDGHIPRLKDAVNSFLKDILRMMTDVFSQRIAMGFTNSIMDGIGGLFSSGGASSQNPVQGPQQATYGPYNDPNIPFLKPSSSVQSRMKVEVINQTKEDVQVSSARVKSDNQGQVLQVVLDGLQRNKGGFRDGLRGGLGIA